MSSRLVNIVRFAGLAVGVPVAQAHNLQNAGRALIPDFVLPSDGGFTITADATNVTVTRNTPADPAAVDVWVWMLPSTLRLFGATNPLPGGPPAIDGSLTPRPFVLSPGASTAGFASSNCLIYQPGGANAGPVIFNDWNDLMTQLTVLRAAANGGGCYQIMIDDSVVSPAVIPAGGPYDMTDVILGTDHGGIEVACSVADGASFTKLRTIQGNIAITNFNTVTSPVADLIANEVIMIDDAVVDCDAQAVPFFDSSGVGPGELWFMLFINAGQVARSAGVAVIRIATAGSLFIPIMQVGGIQRDGLSTIAGSVTIAQIINRGAIFGTQSAVAGSLSISVSASSPHHTLQGNEANPNTGSVSLGTSDVAYYDVSGGAVAETLPQIADPSGFHTGGHIVRLFEVSGSVGLTVAPFAGDTIEGSANAIPVPGGGGVVLISDGLSNWSVLQPPGGQWAVSVIATADPGPVRVGTFQRCDPTGGGFAVTLEAITAENKGRKINVKNSSASANALTITPAGTDTIDGAATYPLAAARGSVTLVSDGNPGGPANWEIE